MTTTPGSSRASEMARLLVALRERRDLSTNAAAAATPGLTQSRLWRAENDKGVLPEKLADEYARAMGATTQERDRLASLARTLRARNQRARVTMSRGADDWQRELRKIEANARVIRNFQPAIVIGSLQTRAYIERVFAPRGVPIDRAAQSVEARLGRQRELDDLSKEWVLIQSEGALRWQAASPELMIEQIEHLVAASHRPNVRLGIVDWRTPADVFAHHGFHVYDENAVQIGTELGSQIITDRQDVAQLLDLFGDLERLASFDDDCRAVLDRIAGEYRQLVTA